MRSAHPTDIENTGRFRLFTGFVAALSTIDYQRSTINDRLSTLNSQLFNNQKPV
ncbi:MAG: hypothetical protein ACRC62_08085 [Microcoleus sp.]